ncbi:MAG: hypothetical protein ABI992_06290 [Chthoniobacterales bacterium]
MKTKIISVLLTITAVGAITLAAQVKEAEPLGTLTLDKKTFPLKHVLAYETTVDDEGAVDVILSGQAVTSEQLKKAQDEENAGGDPNFKRPFLRLLFKKSGEIKHWSAGAGSTVIGRRSGATTGELKQEQGRVIGKAAATSNPEDMFPAGFDVHFETALLKAGESLPASTGRKGGPAANVAPSVTGVFRGNGKDAKLAYVTARWVEPFDGRPGIQLIFTEKDHTKAKKPEFDAVFGHFGSALVISVFEDGQIYGCQVAHSAHKKQGISSTGNIETSDFAYENGKVEGEITTNGEVDTFGEKWEVKIKFVAPLGEIPKEFQVTKPKEPEKPATPDISDADDDKDEAKPAGGGLPAKELALTKDASEVEYKALVQQLGFKSKANVKSACAELAANLKAQGWKNDGTDLVNPQSSILKRKRGEATLTIFVKPAEGGSEVKMMTEGLSWE